MSIAVIGPFINQTANENQPPEFIIDWKWIQIDSKWVLYSFTWSLVHWLGLFPIYCLTHPCLSLQWNESILLILLICSLINELLWGT